MDKDAVTVFCPNCRRAARVTKDRLGVGLIECSLCETSYTPRPANPLDRPRDILYCCMARVGLLGFVGAGVFLLFWMVSFPDSGRFVVYDFDSVSTMVLIGGCLSFAGMCTGLICEELRRSRLGG